ncbi:hypothetical protein DYQ86_18265 [Acidobacteria bacterium AB60]|nr:hypothetical protein DYQ86_18265 [Acidobacteria bacterium AB60]
MVKLNVKNGTPVGNQHLCRRCTWGQFMTGYRESEVLVICRYAEPNLAVPFVVMNCSEFSDRHRPTWEQMTKLAIHVAPSRVSKRTPGFAAAGNVRPIREDEDEDAGEAARTG